MPTDHANPYQPPESQADQRSASWDWLRFIPATFLMLSGFSALCLDAYVLALLSSKQRFAEYRWDGESVFDAITIAVMGLLWIVGGVCFIKRKYKIAWLVSSIGMILLLYFALVPRVY
jgi:hypothetical protein